MWVQPVVGWVLALVGAVTVAIGVMWGKAIAKWLLSTLGVAIVEEVGDKLQPRWEESTHKALAPLHEELRIGEGAEKWPNGSASLPASIKEIYDRQHKTYEAVKLLSGQVSDLERQIESVLTDRPDGR